MSIRRNTPRWTRDPTWIPERFKQSAVNATKRRSLTPVEQAEQYILMYLNHKISLDTCYGLLLNMRLDDIKFGPPQETPLYWLTTNVLDTMADHRDGILDEIVMRGNISNILHAKERDHDHGNTWHTEDAK